MLGDGLGFGLNWAWLAERWVSAGAAVAGLDTGVILIFEARFPVSWMVDFAEVSG